MAKILILSASPLERGGGIETFVFSLIKALGAAHRFQVYSSGKPAFFADLAQKQIHHAFWPARSFLDRDALRALEVFLKQETPDVVHIQDARAAFLARPLLAKLGIASVYSMHLPPYYYAWQGVNRWLRPLLYGLMEAMMSRLTPCRVVFVGNSAYRQALVWRITPKHRAVCIPNGVDLAPYQLYDRLQARSRLAIDEKFPVICCVGRLNVQKMQGRLIQAVASLRNLGLDARLWLVGDGDERHALQGLVAGLGLQDRVVFWGSRADVPCLLAASDLFALPSLYEAGHTLAVMEAQASGLPCVLSDAGDHREMVGNGSGFVFSQGDENALLAHLQTLIANPVLRASMGALARQKAQAEYGIETMAAHYDRLYRQLQGFSS